MKELTLDILAEKLRSIGVYGGNAEKLMPFLSKYLYTSLPPSRSQVVSLKHLAENFPELNMANYNPDGVEELNNWGIEIANCAEELAATLPAEQVPEADMGIPTSTSATVSDEQIKAVFLANGFTIKPGHDDLKPYVYQAARALLATGGQAQAVAEKAAKYDHLLPYLCKTCGGYGLVDRRCNDDPLGSEPCPDCNAAPQPAAQGLVERDEAFEAVRKAFCKLQRYSFFLDSRGNVRRCADHCGNWVEFEAVHTLFEPQSVDAAIAAQTEQGEKP